MQETGLMDFTLLRRVKASDIDNLVRTAATITEVAGKGDEIGEEGQRLHTVVRDSAFALVVLAETVKRRLQPCCTYTSGFVLGFLTAQAVLTQEAIDKAVQAVIEQSAR